jgi:hypothetical protein
MTDRPYPVTGLGTLLTAPSTWCKTERIIP